MKVITQTIKLHDAINRLWELHIKKKRSTIGFTDMLKKKVQ